MPLGKNLRPRRGRGRPAGLGAAVYGASEGLSPRPGVDSPGGQAGTSSRIENYPGFPAGLSGFELASRVLVQADKFGARTAVPQEAVSLSRENGHYHIELSEAPRGRGPQRDSRNRGPLPQAASARPGAFRGRERPLCRYGGRGTEVRGRGGRDRWRGQLGGQAALFLAGRTRRVYLLIREKF